MMKQIKFIQPQCEMVIVGVSIDLTTHADVLTRVRNAFVAHTSLTRPSEGGNLCARLPTQRTAYVSSLSFGAFYSAPRHLMALNFFIFVF